MERFHLPEVRQDDAVPEPLLSPAGIDALRTAFAGFTPDGIAAALGTTGAAALARGDLDGVRRACGEDPVSTLVQLFLTGGVVEQSAATAALAPLALPEAHALLEVDGDSVRAAIDVRPYGPWWVFSDLGSDVRPGRLRPDHVLGVGAASLSLAESVVRDPVATAVDIGTGCGVQSLHLSAHAGRVVATDVSARALRMAATTAALAGLSWELRAGSLLDPLGDETADLIVSNPPFVLSPGLTGSDEGFDYRDSGLSGDGVLRALLAGLPHRLAPGGTAQLLANWVVPPDGDWESDLAAQVAGSGCDAWIWQRETVDPGRYVTLWLDDAAEPPGPQRTARYDRWVGWLEAHGVAAIGMGLITLRRTDRDRPTVVVAEDVPQAVERPSGGEVAGWLQRTAWLARTGDDRLLASALRRAPDLVLDAVTALGPDAEAALRLRRTGGMRWDLETDEAVVALVRACDGEVPLELVLDLLAATRGLEEAAVAQALLPVVRDLVRRGVLLPTGPDGTAA